MDMMPYFRLVTVLTWKTCGIIAILFMNQHHVVVVVYATSKGATNCDTGSGSIPPDTYHTIGGGPLINWNTTVVIGTTTLDPVVTFEIPTNQDIRIAVQAGGEGSSTKTFRGLLIRLAVDGMYLS
jgi:hypothetical protein